MILNLTENERISNRRYMEGSCMHLKHIPLSQLGTG